MSGPVSTWMGDRPYPGQLSLAIPPWLSTNQRTLRGSWQTMRCTSTVSMFSKSVSWCLAEGSGNIITSPYGLRGSGRTLLIFYKKLSYRRETARQLQTPFSAHSLIVHFTEHRNCFTTI